MWHFWKPSWVQKNNKICAWTLDFWRTQLTRNFLTRRPKAFSASEAVLRSELGVRGQIKRRRRLYKTMAWREISERRVKTHLTSGSCCVNLFYTFSNVAEPTLYLREISFLTVCRMRKVFSIVFRDRKGLKWVYKCCLSAFKWERTGWNVCPSEFNVVSQVIRCNLCKKVTFSLKFRHFFSMSNK